MDRELIIRLAREAGVKPLLYDGKWAVEGLDAFAALVAYHEREACAQVCDRFAERDMNPAECAAAIRSRT